MKTEEANKVIAEYMGWKMLPKFYHFKGGITQNKWIDNEGKEGFYRKGRTPYDYISLDALVPVWSKLQPLVSVWLNYSSAKPYAEATIWNMVPKHNQPEELWGDDHIEVKSETIQEAACIATAKAIKELK